MTDRLGDEPIEPEYVRLMNTMAHALDDLLNGDIRPKKIGFCLMMFTFGEGPGRCNYISNAVRDDVVVLLREQLRRFEGAPDVTGRA